MSVPARIVDKLRNYEYEKRGCGDVVDDIYALIHQIAALEKEIDNLRVEAREKNAWEGRYNALLEKVEASRPREVNGDGSDLPAGTVVIDHVGDVWQRDGDGRWSPADVPSTAADYLGDAYAPYTIVYTPEEES